MFLLIVSPEPPSLAILTTDQPGELVFDGEPFMEHAAPVDGGPFLGFYDWLRTCDEAVVGVELTLHDNRCEIREILKRATFGVWTTPEALRIIFAPGEVDPGISVDQEFSISRCYSSAGGRVALLLDASGIEPCAISRAVASPRGE